MVAPTRCTLLYKNLVPDDTEYSMLDENPLYPAENLYNEDIHIVARQNGESGDQTWRIHADTMSQYDTLIFAGHNLTENATVMCEAATSYTSTPDETMTRGVNCYVFYWDTPQTYDFIVIETNDTTGDGYHQIGTIWVGMRLELARNPQIPMGLIRTKNTTDAITVGGQQWSYENYTKHGYDLKFIENFMASGDGMYASLEALYDNRGMDKPFLFDLKPGDSNTPPVFVHTTNWDFSIDGKDARPGNWSIEQEL